MKNSVDQNSFNALASEYDRDFTWSTIGKAQREVVWRCLNDSGLHNTPRTVLEINCGTGYDAQYLASKGHNVLASDASSKMVGIAKQYEGEHLKFKECSIQDLKSQLSGSNYEVVFSNFGGLNCLNSTELKAFFKDLKDITKEDARLHLVIMSSACLWEFAYFFVTLRWSKLFRRRLRAGVEFQTNSGTDRIYYYSPRRIRKLASDYQMVTKQAVGIMIPPSYMQNYFSRRPKMLQKLINIDRRLAKFRWLSNLADHYYIQLKRR